MNKWFFIFMGIAVVTAFVGMAASNVYSQKAGVEYSKNGLEECPNLRANGSNETIWVKDCTKYMETYNKLIKNKN